MPLRVDDTERKSGKLHCHPPVTEWTEADIPAGNVAYYTILHMKSGRRSYRIDIGGVVKGEGLGLDGLGFHFFDDDRRFGAGQVCQTLIRGGLFLAVKIPRKIPAFPAHPFESWHPLCSAVKVACEIGQNIRLSEPQLTHESVERIVRFVGRCHSNVGGMASDLPLPRYDLTLISTSEL